MTYFIGYTSETEGITIGAYGESPVDALAKLAEEFGEGITLLYEHTREELLAITETIEAITETIEPPGQESQGEEDQRPIPAETDESLSIFLEGGEDEDASTDNGTEDGGSSEAHREGAGGDACSICGNEVTADRAKASQLLHGEVRCQECSP